MSRTFLPMMFTVFAAMAVYYFLSTSTGIGEGLSMAGGVSVGVLGAVLTTKLLPKK